MAKKEKEDISVSEKDFSKLSERVKRIEDNVEGIKKDISIQQQQFEKTIKTQEEIIVDMVHRFNDEFLKHKARITTDLEAVKSQQDVLRISYTINESQLMNKIKELISNELKNSIKGKEEQILMRTWIDELKKIVSNFDELKKLHPREFNLQLEEISNIIEMFKQKLTI